MTFLINHHNILDYLLSQEIGELTTQSPVKIESKDSKNSNLLLTFPDNCNLLVKQESSYIENQIIPNFPELSHLRKIISEAIYFDPKFSIIIFKYLSDYCDLEDFYEQNNLYPDLIAEQLGLVIAKIHSSTLDREEYQHFLLSKTNQANKNPNFLVGLTRLSPKIFSDVTYDNLKFFKLYQRYESFEQAIAHFQTQYQSRCLMHNDLKFNNILLNHQWQQILANPEDKAFNPIIRIIDWEKSTWGDPAFDVGRIIASYLDQWLSSLTINTDIELETALNLANTPLQDIQPSINTFIKAYFRNFPEILSTYPNFVTHFIQFTGLALLEQIQVRIADHKPFGNIGVCMLQVAKNLLCFPEKSLAAIFGTTTSELIDIQ
jgi:hypothetical protein